MIEAWRAAGGSPKYSEMKGVRHGSWTPAYRETECLDWMFEQRRLS
jgi:predicted peptidase